jgi:hypothetical protein
VNSVDDDKSAKQSSVMVGVSLVKRIVGVEEVFVSPFPVASRVREMETEP